MITLEDAKLFLRIDDDYEDELLKSLIKAAVDYIETATGLDAESQQSIDLCNTLQRFLVMQWYKRDETENYDVIESLVKTIKAKAATNSE